MKQYTETKEKDWFEKNVCIRLYKRVENVVDNGHLVDVWEIRWDFRSFYETINPNKDGWDTSKLSTIPSNETLREAVWRKVSEKLRDGWCFSIEDLPKLKPYYFVEAGKGDDDDMIFVMFSSENGSKEVAGAFSRYFPESRELAESVCKSLNDKLKPHAEFSLNVYTPIRTDCDSYTGNTSL